MRHHFRILKIPHSQNKSEKKYSCYDDAYMYLTVKNLNQIYSSWNQHFIGLFA
jgi:hypothetical protein